MKEIKHHKIINKEQSLKIHTMLLFKLYFWEDRYSRYMVSQGVMAQLIKSYIAIKFKKFIKNSAKQNYVQDIFKILNCFLRYR